MPPPRETATAYLTAWPVLLIGGAALGLSFPPFSLHALACIALLPLLLRWDRASSWRAALLAAYATFLATFAVVFSWPLNHAMPHVALASLTGVLLLPLWMALPFAVAWPVRRRLGRLPGLAALCASYLCMEAALSLGPLALPWPLLAHTQAEALSINQFADLTGAPGLTLWVLLLNSAVFLWAVTPVPGARRTVALAGALLVFGPLAYSAARRSDPPRDAPTLRVALVQPGMSPDAWAETEDTARRALLLALSDSLRQTASAPPELFIWPETSLAITDRGPAPAPPYPLLTGAVMAGHSDTAAPRYHNTALLLSPRAAPQRYDKRRLVPFVERVPLLDLWPDLRTLALPAGGVAGYERGTSARPLTTGSARVGVLICLESIFGELGRAYARGGANLLVAITQDGWWGRTAGHHQHLAFNRIRAIEARRALVQVSVSGRTALIHPDGSVLPVAGWMERKAQTISVPLLEAQTFFTRHGPWLNYLAVATALFLALAAALRPRIH